MPRTGGRPSGVRSDVLNTTPVGLSSFSNNKHQPTVLSWALLAVHESDSAVKERHPELRLKVGMSTRTTSDREQPPPPTLKY